MVLSRLLGLGESRPTTWYRRQVAERSGSVRATMRTHGFVRCLKEALAMPYNHNDILDPATSHKIRISREIEILGARILISSVP